MNVCKLIEAKTRKEHLGEVLITNTLGGGIEVKTDTLRQ